jgi:poly(3-hydroxybutyrate) depolymerase
MALRHTPLLLWLAVLSPLPAQDPRPPSEREQQQLVEDYFAAQQDGGGRTLTGFDECKRILARLDEAPTLSSSQVKSWRKKIQKQWESGREIEKKSGRAWFFEEEERGLFIVGGEKRKPKGLLLCMHGGGKGSGDAWSSHGAYDPSVSDFDWLAIYPEVLEKTEHGWTDSGTEEFVIDLVEAARRTWGIDPDHVYFAGHSMGGYGTWTLGAHHADTVAALAPSAGAPSPIFGPSGLEDIVAGVIPSLRNVPMVIYQSDDDVQVPPDANRMAVQKLREAQTRWGGFEHEYWEVSGRGHDAPPGGYSAHLAKIAERVRDPHPTKIVWQPALTWKRQFYWLWWEIPQNGALVEAELDRTKNEIRVTCPVNASGLWVLLGPELVDMEKEVTVLLNGEQVFHGVPQPSLAALLLTGVRGDPRLSFEARVPLVPIAR